MAAREYTQFCCWMVEHLGEGCQGIVDSFHMSLVVKYAAGQYPSPPMGQIWESPASSPSDSHGDSFSSIDKLFEDDESADVADCGDLIQGGSLAPTVYILLAEGVAAAMDGVAARGGADEVVAGCLSDKVDMEPLF